MSTRYDYAVNTCYSFEDMSTIIFHRAREGWFLVGRIDSFNGKDINYSKLTFRKEKPKIEFFGDLFRAVQQDMAHV